MVEQRVPMADADPYLLFGLLGKQVTHPGGRRATEELFALASLAPGQQVLDIGCGAGTTAIEMATRFGVTVTAADISPDMRERAIANVRRAEVADRVSVETAEICALPYKDGHFDRVVAEAVTMFVDRDRAIAELVRVCVPVDLCWRLSSTGAGHQRKNLVTPSLAKSVRAFFSTPWTTGSAGMGPLASLTFR